MSEHLLPLASHELPPLCFGGQISNQVSNPSVSPLGSEADDLLELTLLGLGFISSSPSTVMVISILCIKSRASFSYGLRDKL